MAINDLISKIVLEDEFSQAFDSYNKNLAGAETTTQRFGANLRGIVTVAGVVGGALAGAGLAVRELTDAADEARTAETVFNNLSGGSERAAENLEAMTKATTVAGRTVVSETERMQIASQLLGLKIATNAEQLEQTVTVSRRLGAAFKGLGAREAAEEFALMISNMSVPRLDSFGISSGAVRSRIAELMETTAGMTREQAFFQATMEQAGETLNRLGPEIETVASKQAALEAQLADATGALGAQLTPLREGYIEAFSAITASTEGGASIITKALAAIAAGAGTLVVAIKASSTIIQAEWAALVAGATALANLENPAAAFTAELEKHRAEAEGAANVLANLGTIATEAYTGIIAGYQEASQAVDNFGGATQEAADDQSELSDAARKAAEELAAEYEKAAERREAASQRNLQRIAGYEREHARTIGRLQQELAQTTIEAAQEAAAARLAADQQLAGGLAEIERNLGQESARAQADANRQLDQLRQERRQAERDTAREIEQVNRDLGQTLTDLARDTGQAVADVNSDLADDTADTNQDLADELADRAARAEETRLGIIRSAGEQAVRLEQQFADRRKAVNDRFESEFADADPFKRKILEFNRREELALLDQQEADEGAALDAQTNQAITALEERVAAEAAILEREAAQKIERREREAEQRTEAIKREADERAEALRREAEERTAALEQRLAAEIAANEQRQAEIRRQLADEQARRDAAAVEAGARLEQRHAEELAKIQEQEAKKVEQAQAAIERERQNHADRLSDLAFSHQQELAEIQGQLTQVESAERDSQARRLAETRAFSAEMQRLNALAASYGGGPVNRQGDSLGGNNNNVTVINNGVPGGYGGAQQTGRSVLDALNGR